MTAILNGPPDTLPLHKTAEVHNTPDEFHNSGSKPLISDWILSILDIVPL